MEQLFKCAQDLIRKHLISLLTGASLLQYTVQYIRTFSNDLSDGGSLSPCVTQFPYPSHLTCYCLLNQENCLYKAPPMKLSSILALCFFVLAFFKGSSCAQITHSDTVSTYQKRKSTQNILASKTGEGVGVLFKHE